MTIEHEVRILVPTFEDELAENLSDSLSDKALEVIREWHEYGSCQPEGGALIVDEITNLLYAQF